MVYSVRNLFISFAIIIVVVLLIVFRTFSTLQSQMQEHGVISRSRVALQRVGPAIVDMQEFEALASSRAADRDSIRSIGLGRLILKLQDDSVFLSDLASQNHGNAAAYLRLAGLIHEMIQPDSLAYLLRDMKGAAAAAIGYRMPVIDSFKMIAARIENDHRRQLQQSYDRSLDLSKNTAAFMRIISLLLILFLAVSFWFIYKDILNRKGESDRLMQFNAALEKQVSEKADAIRKNEQRYRELFESMTDAYVRVELTGRITEFNPAFRKMTGYSEEEIAGLSYRDIMPGDWLQEDKDIMQRELLPGGYPEVYEKEFRRRDGSVFPIELKTFLLRDESGRPDAIWAIIRDVSARKESEKKLEASAQNLRHAISSTTDVFYVIDKDYRITVLNETAEKNLKIRWGRAVTVGENVLDLLPADKYDEIRKRFDDVMRGIHSEYEVYQPEKGLPPWVLVTFTPILDRGGNVVGASVTAKDISARKIAEQRLKRSEQQLLASIANTPNVAVQWYNEKCEVRFWNAASELIFGWKAHELMGKRADQLLFPGEENEKFVRHFSSVIHSGETIGPVELRFNTKSSRAGHCISTFFSIPSAEGGHCMACMTVDITAQKNIESELREAEAKFRNLVEQSLIGVYITHEGLLTYVNPRFAAIFGYDTDQLSNRVFLDALIRTADGRLPVAGLQEGEHAQFEASGLKQSGEIMEVEIYCSSTRDGNQPAVIGTLLDISERKKVEYEKEQVRHLLNERVKELTTLYKVSQALQEEQNSVPDLLEKIVSILQEGWQYPGITAVRIRVGSLECRTPNFGTAIRRQSVPFPTPGGEIGMIEVVYLSPPPDSPSDAFSPEERNLINIVGEMLSIYLARQHSAEENKNMQRKILSRSVQEQKTVTRAVLQAEERERNKIGRELHDNVNQILASAKLFLRAAAEKNIWAEDELLARSAELLDNAIEEIRLLSQSQVTPTKEIDLGELLQGLVDRLGDSTTIRAILEYEKMPSLQDDLKLNIYRIVQEQINNILKHANATDVMISIVCADDFVQVQIRDNGRGFDQRKRRRGVGITNMINRVESFNGQLNITSSPGAGCLVDIRIPC